jgi:hypothetical protein
MVLIRKMHPYYPLFVSRFLYLIVKSYGSNPSRKFAANATEILNYYMSLFVYNFL